ncbi:MAG: serine/threonine protein kinase [Proteobacteria bacterium]|nr:serine/threonine protein kinase [Pseudomonadota bacterium]
MNVDLETDKKDEMTTTEVESAPPLSTIPDSEVFQRYQLLTRIGSGGMGDVFLGIQRGAVDFQRLVVVKRIHSHYFDRVNTLQMFIDEASLVASLSHPNIVKIIDFCRTETSIYLVMEYVDGETLKLVRSWCKKNQTDLPFPIACNLILEACEALRYAHSATTREGEPLNMIHRDIGLHNLMIDRNGYVKVIDFGIAKSTIQTDRTSPGLLKGNPGYMAPDLFIHDEIDNRIDIYALGLCLYELLTLQRAFSFEKDTKLPQIMHSITTKELETPSSMVDGLPPELDDIVFKAVEKDRGKRYQTVNEMARDLRNFALEYSKQFEDQNVKTWFDTNFIERKNAREHFEQRVLEKAGNSGPAPDRFTSISSNPPPPQTSIMTDMHPYSHQSPNMPLGGLKPRYVYLLIGSMFLVFIGFVSIVYFLSYGDKAPIEKENKVDNLFVYCSPEDAELFVNGENIGKTGDQGRSIHVKPNEKHVVELKKHGYAEYSVAIIGPKTGSQTVVTSLVKIEPVALNENMEVINKNVADIKPGPVDEYSGLSKRRYFRRKSRRKKISPIDKSSSLTDELDWKARLEPQRTSSGEIEGKTRRTAGTTSSDDSVFDSRLTNRSKPIVPLLDDTQAPKVPLLLDDEEKVDRESKKRVPLL